MNLNQIEHDAHRLFSEASFITKIHSEKEYEQALELVENLIEFGIFLAIPTLFNFMMLSIAVGTVLLLGENRKNPNRAEVSDDRSPAR